MKIHRTTAQGFMLLEVALVIMIVGIILGPILHLLAGQRQKNDVLDQLETRQNIAEAVEGFVLATGRLPCPALHTRGQEARNGDFCTQQTGWLPNATLNTWGLSGEWKMAVATLEQAGEPAQHALVSNKPFAKLSPQQLAEIVLAPYTANHATGTGPLPAIHLCQAIASQALPEPAAAGCASHILLSPTAVWVAYPVQDHTGQPVDDINQNRFQQFFINPQTPAINPVWLSFERMNWLWMKRGTLDPLYTPGELN